MTKEFFKFLAISLAANLLLLVLAMIAFGCQTCPQCQQCQICDPCLTEFYEDQDDIALQDCEDRYSGCLSHQYQLDKQIAWCKSVIKKRSKK